MSKKKFSKRDAEELSAKIDNEGGLLYYMFGYGGDLPKEVQLIEKDFRECYGDLVSALQGLGVEVAY